MGCDYARRVHRGYPFVFRFMIPVTKVNFREQTVEFAGSFEAASGKKFKRKTKRSPEPTLARSGSEDSFLFFPNIQR